MLWLGGGDEVNLNRVSLVFRLGVICLVTGIIVLAHYLLTGGGGRVPPEVEVLVAVVLIVLGIPLLVVGVRRH